MSVAENIARIRERIDAAARETGRTGADITLVGASKMNGAAACREAVAAGIDALGENRVQEMREKLAQHAYDGAPLHFIGHLQRNKVRQVVGQVSLIQSAGSLPLLLEIEKAAAAFSGAQSADSEREAAAEPSGAGQAAGNWIQPVLLEVNIAGEAAKSGFSPEELPAAAETALSLPHIRVDGLMAIPPADASPEENRRYFEKVFRLYVDMGRNLFHNKLNVLSMGMSGDYEDAIRAGATMVRVGTAIFGARHYEKTGYRRRAPWASLTN